MQYKLYFDPYTRCFIKPKSPQYSTFSRDMCQLIPVYPDAMGVYLVTYETRDGLRLSIGMPEEIFQSDLRESYINYISGSCGYDIHNANLLRVAIPLNQYKKILAELNATEEKDDQTRED